MPEAEVAVNDTTAEEVEVVAGPGEVVERIDPSEVGDEVAYIVKESKAGWRTSEFWITIITTLAVLFNGIPAPESKEGYIAAGLAAIYAVSRGLAKNKVPNTEEVVAP